MDLSEVGLYMLAGIAILAALSTPMFAHFQYISRKKRVGPTLWGVYSGSSLDDSPELTTFKMRRPSLRDMATAGSINYSRGKAVKSARS